MALNKVMLIGNVGADPEVRYLEQNNPQNPAKVATFRLATTERYRDRNNELRENTEWHNIVVFGRNADVVEKYVKKGSNIYVEGSLRTRSFDGRDGQKHYVTEIRVDNLQLLGRPQDNPANAQQAPAQPVAAQPTPAPQPAVTPMPIVDDDLPF
ncbi:MAG: single-stranded DNA-binding protein [Bacteroidales bacterium]|nr:single-stranded DNA-binding protein [Bacteroidales bacterium]